MQEARERERLEIPGKDRNKEGKLGRRSLRRQQNSKKVLIRPWKVLETKLRVKEIHSCKNRLALVI